VLIVNGEEGAYVLWPLHVADGSQPRKSDRDPATRPAESANLDLLRSTAVILVFVNHLLLFLGLTHEGEFLRPLGRWGVQLFFVHSSLVLMMSLERQNGLRYASPYSAFLLRRCFRIFPLNLLFVAVVCWFRLPLGHLESGAFLPARFGAITIASNLLLIQNVTGSESVLEPLWSLPYEVQICLVLPLLFAGTLASKHVTPLLLVWAGACIAYLTLDALNLPNGILRYSPCFLAGVVAYKLGTGSPRHWPASAWPILLLAITTAFLLRPGIEVGWVCCLGVGLAVSRFHELSDGSLREACRLLARYSYGAYLSHVVLIWLAFEHLGTWPLTARWSLFVVTVVLVPVALYHGIEAPMIVLGRLLVRRRAESSAALSLTPLH
jgi:peptidoglycan/LPS O-acetylase OafA/YrhL